MAIVKLLENKGKLFGLYVDRFQEVPIDLKGAMLEARGRAVNTVNISPCHSGGGYESTHRRARIVQSQPGIQ